MSERDRDRWLEPSPPLPVDGEDAEVPPKRRPKLLPEERRSGENDEPARDPEDSTTA